MESFSIAEAEGSGAEHRYLRIPIAVKHIGMGLHGNMMLSSPYKVH